MVEDARIEAPSASFRHFDRREDGYTKVVLDPFASVSPGS
jgi:hypothetical protein